MSFRPAATVELPNDDGSIAALDDVQRARVAHVWSERAESELAAARGMSIVAAAVLARAPSAEVAWLATRAVSDEVRHAALCLAVAARYAGRELAWPEPRRADPTQPPDPIALAPPPLRPLLAVIATCAVHETIAMAFLQRCLDATRSAVARAAIRGLLADELDHARLGWAFVAMLSARERAELRPHVGAVVAACEAVWRKRAQHTGDLGHDLGEHGCPSSGVVDAIVTGAIDELVRPGLARADLGADGAPREGT